MKITGRQALHGDHIEVHDRPRLGLIADVRTRRAGRR